MFTILTGPEAIARAHAWAEKRPTLWIDYTQGSPPPESCPIDAPAYSALAALATRLAHPTLAATSLRITNLASLATGGSAERAPSTQDFSGQPTLMRLSALVARGQPVHSQIALIELSRLYDQVMAQIGRGLPNEQQKTLEFGRALASEALAHLISDLKRSGKEILATTSDVLIGKKLYPNIPGSVRSLAELELACEARTQIVTRSLLPSFTIGQEIS